MTRWWLFQSCNRLNTRNNDTVYHHLNGYQTGKKNNRNSVDFCSNKKKLNERKRTKNGFCSKILLKIWKKKNGHISSINLFSSEEFFLILIVLMDFALNIWNFPQCEQWNVKYSIKIERILIHLWTFLFISTKFSKFLYEVKNVVFSCRSGRSKNHLCSIIEFVGTFKLRIAIKFKSGIYNTTDTKIRFWCVLNSIPLLCGVCVCVKIADFIWINLSTPMSLPID